MVSPPAGLPHALTRPGPPRSPSKAAAAHGWIDRERAIDESLTAIVRAGADAVLTYWAVEAAERWKDA